ncbi:MAG TPA: hypothetical protein VGF25_00120 [Thermoleophilaceae bacterium]|jgi:tetrahydromethanopterin S-methyltransferase subunit C
MPPLRLHHDDAHPRLEALRHVFWGLCGSIVLVCIVVAIVGGVEPADAVEMTIVVLVLAVLWLAHEWRLLWRAERR